MTLPATLKSATGPAPMAPMTIQEKQFLDSEPAFYHVHIDDSVCHDEHCCKASATSHRTCHRSRLRFMLFPALLLLMGFLFLLALACARHTGDFLGTDLVTDLIKRATQDPTTGNGPFVQRKLYLIIVFVGLIVVVILAVMLSAWCCKGAFRNPLCCPCYLCACCGGLACLECIGCGLCAEGLSDI